MTATKAWWTSKTIWTNLIALTGAIVVSAGFEAGDWTEVSTVILAAVNLVLRLVTKDQVALTSEPVS